MGILRAIELIKEDEEAMIHTDSAYGIKCVSDYGQKMKKLGYPKEIPNINIIKKLMISLENKPNIKFLILARNIGKQNIGMGELDELIFTSQNVDFKLYDKIVYFTLRKFVTNPWIFEKVNNLQKNILVSNPPFLTLKADYSFNFSKPTSNLYNDMFFAMSSELMLKYIDYSINQMIINIKKQIGSEQNLYNFININNYEYEWLEYLGLIRIDYKASNEIQLI